MKRTHPSRDTPASRTLPHGAHLPGLDDLVEIIVNSGGVCSTATLLLLGYRSNQLTAAIRSGRVVRARQGQYMLPNVAEAYLHAVRVGGRLTGFSAAASYGLATPPDFPFEVHVAPNAARLRQRHDRHAKLDRVRDQSVIVHHGVLAFDESSGPLRVSLLDCLRQVVLSGDHDDAVATIDSARHRCAISSADLEVLRRSLPIRRRHVLDQSRADVPEYLESIARLRLEKAGFVVRVQVNVLGERWIDLLIGDRLAIECDGKGKYENGATVDKDRKRDAFLEALGYHVVRLSYAMVLYDWDATLSMIAAIVARGDHLARTA